MSRFDLVVSYSRLKRWGNCTQEHHYKYVEKLEPRRKSFELAGGDAVHELLKCHALGEEMEPKADELEDKYALLLEDDPRLISVPLRVCKRYARHYKKDDLEWLAVEQKFGPVPLIKTPKMNIGFIFYIDGLARRNDRSLWLVERKSSKKQKDPQDRVVDMQTCLYIWGLLMEDHNVQGVCWDEIRLKLPTIPRLLVRGGISRAKRMDTDYATYMRTLKKHDLDPKKYKDVLTRLKKEKNNFFRRQYFPIKTPLINGMLGIAQRLAMGLYMHQHDAPLMNVGFRCKFCDYRPLCEATLMDLDTDFMKRADYKVRTYGKAKKKAKGRGRRGRRLDAR